ncbi:MAG: hypothetical protein ACHQNT_09045 [Bacteroidia bacterium]
MKKILCFLIILSGTIHFSFAQDKKINEALVPMAVVDSFKVKYKKLEIKSWYDSDGNYAAAFIKGATEFKATFTVDGKWLRTSTEIKEEAVSGAVKKSIKNTEWKDWKIGDCYKVETPEIKKLFVLHMKKGKEKKILTFDPLGKAVDIK